MANVNPELQLEHLAARQSLRFVSAAQLDDDLTERWYMYGYDRARDVVAVWCVDFDHAHQMIHGEELLAFDPESAPVTVPDCILRDVAEKVTTHA